MSHPDSLTMVGDSCASCGRNRRFHEGMGGFTGTGYCSLVSVVCKAHPMPWVKVHTAEAVTAFAILRIRHRAAIRANVRALHAGGCP